MTPVDRHPAPDDQQEALAFLRSGRRLRGLSPAQYRRVGQSLAYPVNPRKRRRLWMPLVAAFGLVLVAGTALARVVDFSRMPLIGPLFHAPESQPANKKTHAHTRRALLPSAVPSNPLGEGSGAVVARPTEGPGVLPAPSSVGAASSSATLATPEPRTPSALAHPSAVMGSSLAAPARQPRKSWVRETPAPSVLESPAPETATPRPFAAAAPSAYREDPVLVESRSFSEAAARWHRDHDAKSALAALEAHERGFPRGQMRTETQLLRAEILLQQGREPESLALLDRLLLGELPRGRELLTVRGELRVKYGRCPEARRDLERVLFTNHGDALARRAARALALCPGALAR